MSEDIDVAGELGRLAWRFDHLLFAQLHLDCISILFVLLRLRSGRIRVEIWVLELDHGLLLDGGQS